MGKKVTASDFFNEAVKDILNIESLCVPPVTAGQQPKNYQLEDIRWFLCTAISADLKRCGTSSKPIRNEKLVQELVLYYHIIGYADTDAKEKIIAILDRKEVFDGE